MLIAVLISACNYVVLFGYDWFGFRLIQPRISNNQIAIAQTLVAALDLLLSAGVLYVFVPADEAIAFLLQFAGITSV